MAVHIPIEVFSNEEKMKIARELHLLEKPGPIFANKPHWMNDKERKCIDFYKVFKDEDGKDFIALPYAYTTELTGVKFPNHRLKKESIDPFYMKEKFKLFDYQEEAIELAKEDIDDNGTCFFNVFCAFGKTVVGAVLSQIRSQRDGLLTLVIYPRKPLGRSWEGTFNNLTTAKTILFEKGVNIADDVQVILCMDTQICNLPAKIIDKVGHLLMDESHMLCTPSDVEGLLKLTPKYITCLTATYERDDGFEIMIDHMIGYNRIVKISKKPFFVIQMNTSFTPQDVKMTAMGVDYNDLINKIDGIDERTYFIYQLIFANIQQKILILTKHIPRVEKLYTELKRLLEPYGKKVSRYAGKDKSYDDGDIIIGTMSKIGVGFDEKETCNKWNGVRLNFLILDSSTKKIEQIAGRVFRAPLPVIIDIVDNHTNLVKHWNLRRSWYTSRNGIIYQTNSIFRWMDLYATLYKHYQIALDKEKNNPSKTNRINSKDERDSKKREFDIEDYTEEGNEKRKGYRTSPLKKNTTTSLPSHKMYNTHNSSAMIPSTTHNLDINDNSPAFRSADGRSEREGVLSSTTSHKIKNSLHNKYSPAFRSADGRSEREGMLSSTTSNMNSISQNGR